MYIVHARFHGRRNDSHFTTSVSPPPPPLPSGFPTQPRSPGHRRYRARPSAVPHRRRRLRGPYESSTRLEQAFRWPFRHFSGAESPRRRSGIEVRRENRFERLPDVKNVRKNMVAACAAYEYARIARAAAASL